MQHDTSPHDVDDRRRSAPRADRVAGAVLLADALLPALPALHPLRVQGLPDRRAAVLRRRVRAVHDRQHARRGAARAPGKDMVPVPEMAAFARALRLRLRGAREGRRQPLGARRAALRLHREQLPRRPRIRRLGRRSTARRAPGATRSTPRHKRHLHASPARALRRRAAAPRAAAALGARGLRAPPAHRRLRGLRQRPRQSLLGARGGSSAAASRCARPRTGSSVFDGPRCVAVHDKRVIDGADAARDARRAPAAARRRAPRTARRARPRRRELVALGARARRLRRAAQAARAGRGAATLRRLLRDGARLPARAARSRRCASRPTTASTTSTALERMVLRRIAGDFFVLPGRPTTPTTRRGARR